MPRTQHCAAGERVTTKPASVYWSWYPFVGNRVCYRAYYCREHVQTLADLLRRGIASLDDNPGEFVSACMQCGDKLLVGAKYIWATIFLPGLDTQRAEFYLCEDCWLGATSKFAQDGQLMAERSAPQDEIAGSLAWAQLVLNTGNGRSSAA